MIYRKAVPLFFVGMLALLLTFSGCDDLVTETNNITVYDTTLGLACFDCHTDEDNRLTRPKAQWANSAHASDSLLDILHDLNGSDYTVNDCGPECHSHEGFIREFDSLALGAIEHYNVIGCFTCHMPHTGNYGTWSDSTLRALGEFVYLANDSTFVMGKSNMCAHCHKATSPALAAGITDDVLLTATFGPHYSGQADVLSGKGGFRFADSVVASSHQSVANLNGCLRCHYLNGQGYSFGEHTFRLERIDGVDTTQYLVNCVGSGCHAALENFHDVIGSGMGYYRLDSIVSLADSLETLLKGRTFLDPDDPAGMRISADSVIPADAARILYNYLLYKGDGSRGIHNARFVQALLTESVVWFDSLPPTAAFSAADTSGCAPLTVDFTDESKGNVVSWDWTFGDLTGTSDQPNPTYTYDTAGIYTCSLIVAGPSGAADTLVRASYIQTYETTALFTASPLSGCSTLVVDFADLSPGDVQTWEWDFGDGITSFEQSPQHSYDSADVFDVRLIVSDSCGWDTLTYPGYIKIADAAPVAGFFASDTLGAPGLTVNFTDTSSGLITSWDWDFGDPNSDDNSSTEQNPQHTYDEVGTYTVVLTVENECGQSVRFEPELIKIE